MPPRLLLDTHILVRWTQNRKKLSRDQLRALTAATRRKEPLAFSVATLVEIAILVDAGKIVLKTSLNQYFAELQADLSLLVLPLTFEIAAETARLRTLRDPMDCTIAATACVHNLTLVTSDQRIIESGLTPVLA